MSVDNPLWGGAHASAERLSPYARNARTHSAEQVDQIAASIREWGWTNPVLVAEDGTIFAVLRLSTVPYLVGACTGRSVGFSPLRMRST